MKTVYISWNRAAPLLLLLSFMVVLLVMHFLSPSSISQNDDRDLSLETLPRSTNGKTTYNLDGSLGNYETTEAKRTGPGEMGKGHRLKPEQKNEEEALKGLFVNILFLPTGMIIL